MGKTSAALRVKRAVDFLSEKGWKPLNSALSLFRQGFALVELKPKSKGARHDGWPDIRYASEDEVVRAFGGGANVGAIMGEASGWVVDVDLDRPDAVELAPRFLPSTVTFGRKSKRRSHYLYLSPGSRMRNYFRDLLDASGKPVLDDEGRAKREKFLELRCGHGIQTMMPGSIHDTTGEPIEWTDEADAERLRECIRVIESHELLAAVDALAKACRWTPKPAPVRQEPRPLVGSSALDPYARAALGGEVAAMRSAAEGGRNSQLNESAFKLFQLVERGELDAAEVERELAAAARSTGLEELEIRATMRSAMAGAARNPRGERKPMSTMTPPAPVEPRTQEEEDALVRSGGGYVEELREELAALRNRPMPGIPVPGFPKLTDTLAGLRGFTLLTGPSGLGKSTFANAVALNVASGRETRRRAEALHGLRAGHEPVPVIYFTSEMTRTEMTLSMLSALSGKAASDIFRGSDVEREWDALGKLQSEGMLRIYSTEGILRPWEHHALEGIEDVIGACGLKARPVLVIIDSLAWLEPPPRAGRPHRSELDVDRDIVAGLVALKRRMHAAASVLAVHEESKAATGSGDGHAVRGSSRYLYGCSQRLVMTRADGENGTRRKGVRLGLEPEHATEVDLHVEKARAPGTSGHVITWDHYYMAATVVEHDHSIPKAELRAMPDAGEDGKPVRGRK